MSASFPHDAHRGGSSAATDFAAQANPVNSSPLAQPMSTASPFATGVNTAGPFSDGSSTVDDAAGYHDRSASAASTAVPTSTPSRSNTLKKRGSVRRTTSLKKSSSKKSLKAGNIAGYGDGEAGQQYISYSTTPIPTSGSPTEILANRFQAWRQLLKSLIAYFREVQASYESRAKATHKMQNVIASMANPSTFVSEHGLGEASRILDDYHKRTMSEANKSREIEEDVIGALTGLRSDLGQKIKEIKSLSGDFKNSVDKEQDATRREVERLQESIRLSERDDGSAMGKNDPFVVKMGVDRAVERQIDEENYLHRAYLNLESSGRELESIVVGEIQKAYNALAGILKREGDDAYNALDALRSGPIAMPKDAEWSAFVEKDSHFVDPGVPLRRVEDIEYPGKHHPSAAEVRAGMLERKSKYLKSYTPGWYVLSPTHLHEFKSADKIYSQPPVTSLYLPDQKLGSHSQQGSSSHKFMVKGKQSGSMHKGHNWVFRAESYDTMLAWYEDMNILVEKRGEERNAFVRKHARSFSSNSRRASISSDGMDDDEADQVPYSADASSLAAVSDTRPARPQPGGRFPSDLQIPRTRAASDGAASSTTSSPNPDAEVATAGGTGLLAAAHASDRYEYDPYRLDGVTAGTRPTTADSSATWTDGRERGSYFGTTGYPVPLHMQQSNQDTLGTIESGGTEPTVLPAAAAVGVVTLDGEESRPERLSAAAIPVISPVPEVPEKPFIRHEPGSAAVSPLLTGSAGLKEEVANLSPVSAITQNPGEDGLGGLEREGARETGSFPLVVKHDTSLSVSQLHVPGTFPKQG